MTGGGRHNRREERKYKRITVRYGAPEPTHRGTALQISTRGFFVSTNGVIFEKGSPIVIEIKGPDENWIVPAVVRHAYKVHPSFAHVTRPGMGIELLVVAPALRDYLASL